MASHMAHEIKNALVPVALQLNHLRSAVEDNPEGLEVLEKLEAGFAAVDAAAADLLFFSADRRVSRQIIQLRDLVREVCDRLVRPQSAEEISVKLDISPLHTIMADRELLRRAVFNLVRHALAAMPQGGELVITSYDGSDALELEIADSGPTLDAEARRRVFEPFGASKDLESGLGLAVVRHIALEHGGSASALTCPEGGTAYTLRFPHGAVSRGRREAA
jgi:signal transduction histidine kinase